jgi:cytochrome c553
MNGRPLATATGLVVAALVCGAAISIGFGLTSVAASSGHWPVTDWLLHFTMRRAVAMQALGVEAPPLSDPALVVRGAGHYADGCAPCHGQPGAAPGPIPSRMTPPPPDLAMIVAEWQPRELFWIVKHGIKFTGMPAWPAAERDDEVWAVVAFLLRLPSLTPDDYRRLVFGSTRARSQLETSTPADEGTDAGRLAADACDRCHRHANADAFPKLRRLSAAYLEETLASFSAGRRPSGIMEPQAAALSAEAIERLAEHYAAPEAAPEDGRERAPEPGAADGPERAREPAQSDAAADAAPVLDAAARRGRAIALDGVPTRDVPACAHCHGPNVVADNPLFPPLAGQPADYLRAQLELWAADRRGGGTPYADLMRYAVGRLDASEVADVAAYYAALAPGTR